MESFAWALVGILLLVVAWLIFAWRWERGRVRRGNLGRLRIAQRGESDAEKLLQSEGYAILERQLSLRWTLWVDGEPESVLSRADLLVERHGLTYIAEVKTGTVADPTKPSTRRQLLEYLHAFDVDGVLLVDPAEALVQAITFYESG